MTLVQSGAIIRYIARKYDLGGDSPELFDMVLDQAKDYDGTFTGMCYREGLAVAPAFLKDTAPPMLQRMVEQLGDKPYFTGATLSAADLVMYELLDKLRIYAREASGANILANYPSLAAVCNRVEAVPSIKKYLASEASLVRPINNPQAKFR